MTTEQDYRVAIGAYVLGGLEPQEVSELEAHIETCPECQQELAEFTETAAQLSLVPPELLAEALDDQPAPSDQDPADELVLQRALREIRIERTGARRRRVLAIAAAVAALVAAPVITAVVVGGNGGQQIAQPSASTGRTVQGRDPATGVSGVATLAAASWGTKLQAKFTDEPRGATCKMVVVSTSNERQIAGNWTVTDTAAAGAGTNVQGSVSIPTTDIARLEVWTAAGQRLLTITT